MINQRNPQIEARPALPPTLRKAHMHLSQPHPRPAPQKTMATSTQPPNIALAGLQLLVGYEWLVSGGDKLLFGVFPARLGGLLSASVSGGQLPSFFAAILRGLVLPNAVLFGYLIEWSETLAGLVLMTIGLVVLLRPFIARYLSGTSAAMFVYGIRLLEQLALIAATGAGLLGLSYFFLDGLPLPWFIPSIAYGRAINTGLFLAAASVVLVVSQFAQRHQSR
jgi:hypothetical protein